MTHNERTARDAARYARLVAREAQRLDSLVLDVILPAAAAAYYRGEDVDPADRHYFDGRRTA